MGVFLCNYAKYDPGDNELEAKRKSGFRIRDRNRGANRLRI
jgi:hypothetical protein